MENRPSAKCDGFEPVSNVSCEKNPETRILRPIFSLLVETIGSQVVVSMCTCSRRPPIFDLPGCQQDLEIVVRKRSLEDDVLLVVVSSCVAAGEGIGNLCDVVHSPR